MKWGFALFGQATQSEYIRGLGPEGGGGGVNVTEVIVVRVCEPEFRNLLHSYTWPLKKSTYSYT